MASLVDVNILIAFLHARHSQSPAAVNWLERQVELHSVLICRVAQMGALRLLSHPVVMKGDVLSADEFWKGWDRMMEDDRFSLVAEPEGFDRVWRQTTSKLAKGKNVETDAYLAAFARAGNWKLVTLDRGCHRFTDTQLEILG
jgi:toxin-antitoxin system PIN domain toxin